MLRLSCPLCSQDLQVEEKYAGARVGCPRCGRGNRHTAQFCYACGWAFHKAQTSVPPPALDLKAADRAVARDARFREPAFGCDAKKRLFI